MDILKVFNALPGAVDQGIIWGIMAIGVFITYKVLDIADLSVDGSIVTGMAVCTVLITGGCNVWLAMLVAIIAGMLAGLLTGVFNTFLGIPAILAGILTQLILWSVNLKIMGKANLPLPVLKYDLILSGRYVYVSMATLALFVVVIIALTYCFFGTRFGTAVRATGCNERMARAQGVNTDVIKVVGLILSNGLVALSGALLAQYQGNADINNGRGIIVIGLAAVIIGDVIFSLLPVKAQNFAVRLFCVVLGGVIYQSVYQVVIFMGIDAELLKMFSAIVVAIFLAVPYLKKTYFTAPVHKKHKEVE